MVPAAQPPLNSAFLRQLRIPSLQIQISLRREFSRADYNFQVFQHGLQDGYLSLNPHVKGGLFPLYDCSRLDGTASFEDNHHRLVSLVHLLVIWVPLIVCLNQMK